MEFIKVTYTGDPSTPAYVAIDAIAFVRGVHSGRSRATLITKVTGTFNVDETIEEVMAKIKAAKASKRTEWLDSNKGGVNNG